MSPADRSNGHSQSPAAMSPSELETRVRKIFAKCRKAGISPEEVAVLKSARELQKAAAAPKGRGLMRSSKTTALVVLGVVCLIALFWLSGAATSHRVVSAWLGWWGCNIEEEKCVVENPDWLQQTLRTPAEDCSVCVGVDDVDRVAQISPELFERKYASSGRPVVIEDAMRNWTAPSVFSFQYLRELYRESPQSNCQFFPYKTEFRRLAEFFNMSQERATGLPWYVGWSNCDDRVSRELRRHYARPYFLPEHSENKQLDWIFMGSPGYGAHMHVDNVGHVSWQAQLKGQKLWVLQPPPECLYRCSFLETILKPGDIIVLDTNRWYHSTLIVSDDVSITIGAEFD